MIKKKLFLVFLKLFLTEVQNVNEKSESVNDELTTFVNSLVLLTKSLCAKFVLPSKRMDKVQTKVEGYLHPKPCLDEFEIET
jgi:hypothetical protein